MTPFAAAQITKDRLRLWQKRNEQANQSVTPLLLVSINHDPGKSGQMVINTVEELTNEGVIGVFEGALKLLKESAERKAPDAPGKN